MSLDYILVGDPHTWLSHPTLENICLVLKILHFLENGAIYQGKYGEVQNSLWRRSGVKLFISKCQSVNVSKCQWITRVKVWFLLHIKPCLPHRKFLFCSGHFGTLLKEVIFWPSSLLGAFHSAYHLEGGVGCGLVRFPNCHEWSQPTSSRKWVGEPDEVGAGVSGNDFLTFGNVNDK